MTIEQSDGVQEVVPATTESSATSGFPNYVGRIGIAFMAVPHSGDNRELFDGLIAGLKRDARVRDIDAPTFEEANPSRPPVAWSDDSVSNHDGELPTTPTRHHHVLVLDRSIRFCVSVPRRLQGPDEDAVPAETYWVAWDGFMLTAIWEFPLDESRNPVGSAGGIVALEVLEKALSGLPASIAVQPCGPNCSYPFAHMDLLLRKHPAASEPFDYATGPLKGTVTVRYEPVSNPIDLVADLSDDLDWVGHSFAFLRSEGAALINIQEQGRRALQELLALYYRRSAVTAAPSPMRIWNAEARAAIADRWEMFGWRRESSRHIATLWLLLSTLEARRYDWHTRRFVYDSSMVDDSRALIFSIEYDQEINAIEGMDTTSLRAATEQAAARLDNRAIATATLAGAVAGGAVGGAASIITLLT